ncbi:MAG: Mth938-like domain-containing protein [Gammaproteobacteria bacterium]|nr:Mth938-like domain-containing protein [Gammaproteobacteria bacterium]MCP5137008.1 Mth938-like domain-containing protein [Gammaproteobacteria bacterium]
MRLNLDTPGGGNRITAYESGSITINGRPVRRHVIVSPSRLEAWEISGVDELTLEHLEAAFEDGVEVVLLGTGNRQRFPDTALMIAAIRRGIGLEIMDTPAACRTYNVLSGEGRRVVAALIVDP